MLLSNGQLLFVLKASAVAHGRCLFFCQTPFFFLRNKTQIPQKRYYINVYPSFFNLFVRKYFNFSKKVGKLDLKLFRYDVFIIFELFLPNNTYNT